MIYVAQEQIWPKCRIQVGGGASREREVNEDAVFKSPGEKEQRLAKAEIVGRKELVGLRNFKAMELITDTGRGMRRV